MLVHHLNCATFRPRGLPQLVAHVLLVEQDQGLLLVDTGYGTAEIADPGRLGKPYLLLARPVLDHAETALAQVKALGFAPGDVSDIVLTHLDSDHAGGLADFPGARVHVHRSELQAATHPKLTEKGRYLAAQWAHGPDWVEHEEPGDAWFGFPSVTALGDDVLLIPLLGHTRGHAGVAVRDAAGHWLLHAGDAFFDHQQIQTPPSCRRSLTIFQRLVEADHRLRIDNTERLRELVAQHSDEVTVFCAHDKQQYDELSGRSSG